MKCTPENIALEVQFSKYLLCELAQMTTIWVKVCVIDNGQISVVLRYDNI